MPTIFEPDTLARILGRVDRLDPARAPLWGRMTAPEMVCHLNCAMRSALGELETRPPHGPLSHWPLNKLAIHVVPWPRGKAKSPREFLARKPDSWDADRRELSTLLDRIAKRGAEGTWPASVVFGRINGRDWGVLTWKHVHHHLEQFGV